jgi:hypothetical protein
MLKDVPKGLGPKLPLPLYVQRDRFLALLGRATTEGELIALLDFRREIINSHGIPSESNEFEEIDLPFCEKVGTLAAGRRLKMTFFRIADRQFDPATRISQVLRHLFLLNYGHIFPAANDHY